jgi:hypothetical protein
MLGTASATGTMDKSTSASGARQGGQCEPNTVLPGDVEGRCGLSGEGREGRFDGNRARARVMAGGYAGAVISQLYTWAMLALSSHRR